MNHIVAQTKYIGTCEQLKLKTLYIYIYIARFKKYNYRRMIVQRQ